MWFIPGFFLAVVVFLLRPFWRVRFCSAGFDRIGNLYGVLYYLIFRDAGGKFQRTTDILYLTPHTSFVANSQWKLMIGRRVAFFPLSGLCWAVEQVLLRLFATKAHLFPVCQPPAGDVLTAVLRAREPLLKFTAGELRSGKEGLCQLGVPDGKEFICFHTRDAAYLKKAFEGVDWKYHDYRDTSIRNYALAAEQYVLKTGRYAVRMGAVVAETMNAAQPLMIDYAASGRRSDLMDIYLSSQCRFFLSTDCGMTVFPEFFRRPVVYVNWVANFRVPHYYNNGRVILKKWYAVKEKRFLTLAEMFHLLGNKTIDLKSWCVELVDNTPEEILAVMKEIDEMIEGSWSCTAEDERLQAGFWDLCGREKWHSSMFRVGREFLRAHAQTLGMGR